MSGTRLAGIQCLFLLAFYLCGPAWEKSLDSRLRMSGMTEGEWCGPAYPSCHSRRFLAGIHYWSSLHRSSLRHIPIVLPRVCGECRRFCHVSPSTVPCCVDSVAPASRWCRALEASGRGEKPVRFQQENILFAAYRDLGKTSGFHAQKQRDQLTQRSWPLNGCRTCHDTECTFCYGYKSNRPGKSPTDLARNPAFRRRLDSSR